MEQKGSYSDWKFRYTSVSTESEFHVF